MRASTFSRLSEGIPLRRIGILALAAAIATIGLVTYGSWVRVSGSGLGCPDWPLCNGGLIPGGDRAAAIEYGHRLLPNSAPVPLSAHLPPKGPCKHPSAVIRAVGYSK